jgi:hypothetical protein
MALSLVTLQSITDHLVVYGKCTSCVQLPSHHTGCDVKYGPQGKYLVRYKNACGCGSITLMSSGIVYASVYKHAVVEVEEGVSS